MFWLRLPLTGPASSNHPGMAQQIGQQNIDTAVPMPDTGLRPSLTANDVADIARQAPPAEPEAEPKQETAAPASEPAKPEPKEASALPHGESVKAEPIQDATSPGADPATADAAVSQQQIGATVPMPDTTTGPPPLTAKGIASSPSAAPAETAKAAREQDAATPASASADAAVSQQQIGAAFPMPDTTLPPPLTAKDIASSPNATSAETAQSARKQETAAPGPTPPRRTARCPNNRSAQRSRCRIPHCRRR